MNFLPCKYPDQIKPEWKGRRLAVTGHRPLKLGGYGPEHFRFLFGIALDWLFALKPSHVVSGVAQGWDSAIIEACLTIRLPYDAYVPFPGQESLWPKEAQAAYNDYLLKAQNLITCSPAGYAREKMQVRNERMVQWARYKGRDQGLLLALWDGTFGGTNNCVTYAEQMDLPIINAWDHYKTEKEKV